MRPTSVSMATRGKLPSSSTGMASRMVSPARGSGWQPIKILSTDGLGINFSNSDIKVTFPEIAVSNVE